MTFESGGERRDIESTPEREREREREREKRRSRQAILAGPKPELSQTKLYSISRNRKRLISNLHTIKLVCDGLPSFDNVNPFVARAE